MTTHEFWRGLVSNQLVLPVLTNLLAAYIYFRLGRLSNARGEALARSTRERLTRKLELARRIGADQGVAIMWMLFHGVLGATIAMIPLIVGAAMLAVSILGASEQVRLPASILAAALLGAAIAQIALLFLDITFVMSAFVDPAKAQQDIQGRLDRLSI